MKVYLIEANTNPCLETSAGILMQRIITDMVDNALRIALDPLFPPPDLKNRMCKNVSLMQWHLSFDEHIDGPLIEERQKGVNGLVDLDLDVLDNEAGDEFD